MKITFLGHSCFVIEDGDTRLIIDPFLTENSWVNDFNIEQLQVQFILISHAHRDHCADVERIASLHPAHLVSNYEIINYFKARGLSGTALNFGGHLQLNQLTVKYVPALHSSSFSDGSYGGEPGGFVFWNKTHCIYYAGDTALSYDMKTIPLTCPAINLAILPIGDVFTMNYKEAALASDFVECNNIIGCHYDTFPPIKIDKEKVSRYFEEKNKNLRLLAFNQSIEL